MKIKPIEHKYGKPKPTPITFGNKIYRETIKTSYGRCIEGGTDKFEYFINVAENPITKVVKHKLYVVNKLFGEGKEKWVKSFLRYFKEDSDNKMVKEIRSKAK